MESKETSPAVWGQAVRGEILQYDDNVGKGLISGEDGIRYTFRRGDLGHLRLIRPGLRVDFVPSNGAATEILVMESQAASRLVEGTGEDLSLWGYFRKCVGRSFDGHGRARRKEYWGFALFLWLFVIGGVLVAAMIAGSMSYQTYDGAPSVPGGVALILVGLMVLAFIPASISVTIRRLHDIGLTGWLVLVALIPYLGALFLFVCSLINSEARANKHGPVPKPM